MTDTSAGAMHHVGHFLTNPANLITTARIVASPIAFFLILALSLIHI